MVPINLVAQLARPNFRYWLPLFADKVLPIRRIVPPSAPLTAKHTLFSSEGVQIQAFIFNWRGHSEQAALLEKKLQAIVDVTVINSDDTVRKKHAHWIHLGESAYFCAQWNAALARFKGDIFFHIQADAWYEDFTQLLNRACATFARNDVGVYEPNIDYTDLRYDVPLLREVEKSIYEVPLTDCTCWLIRRSVLKGFKPIQLSINRYGWGVPGIVAAKCHMTHRICVRDYSLLVQHPQRRGYPNEAALKQRDALFRSLDIEHRQALQTLYQAYSAQRQRAV